MEEKRKTVKTQPVSVGDKKKIKSTRKTRDKERMRETTCAPIQTHRNPNPGCGGVSRLNDSKAEKTRRHRNDLTKGIKITHNRMTFPEIIGLIVKSEKHACFHSFSEHQYFDHRCFRIITWWRRGESIWQKK